MAWETFPCSYTSPHIHLWIFETLRVIIFWVRVTHKMLNVNSSIWPTHPTPPLHDTPHPTLPLHDPPTPPHPFMTHPPHPPLHDPPTPSLHDPSTPSHPWYIFGHKGVFFHGLLHCVSLSVDNKNNYAFKY